MSKFLLMDIGGTNLRIATANEKRIISEEETKSAELFNKLNELKKEKFDLAVIAFAGQIDRKNAIARNGPNNQIKNLSFRNLGKRVILIRDTVAQLVAESQKRKEKNIIFLTISTGIGMSAIIDGKIVQGKDGNFGEIGHTVINFDDNVLCSCKRKNHIEAYIGGHNLEKIAKEKGKDIDYLLDHLNEFREGEKILNAYVSLFENIINLFDPELIIVGGPAYIKHKRLFRSIIKETKNRVIVRMPKIIGAKIKNNDIMGAWIIAKNPKIILT